MHSVRLGQGRHIGAIVDDKQCSGLSRQGSQAMGPFQQVAVRQVLVSQLNDIGSASGQIGDQLAKVRQRAATVQQHVDASGSQAIATSPRCRDCPFQRVHSIAKWFNSGGHAGREQFGVFLQNAKCLFNAFETGGRDLCRGGAVVLGRRANRRADVPRRVPRRVEVFHRKCRHRLGNRVADFLAFGGQMRVLQDKSQVFLDYPQPLAAAVEIGVENPQRGGFGLSAGCRGVCWSNRCGVFGHDRAVMDDLSASCYMADSGAGNLQMVKEWSTFVTLRRKRFAGVTGRRHERGRALMLLTCVP